MSFKSIVNGQTMDGNGQKTDQKSSPCYYVTGELKNQEFHQCHSLEPDQDRHFVVPDLGPNCLQVISR